MVQAQSYLELADETDLLSAYVCVCVWHCTAVHINTSTKAHSQKDTHQMMMMILSVHDWYQYPRANRHCPMKNETVKIKLGLREWPLAVLEQANDRDIQMPPFILL